MCSREVYTPSIFAPKSMLSTKTTIMLYTFLQSSGLLSDLAPGSGNARQPGSPAV